MKKTDLAYFAGIVDGEGCIGIYPRGKTGKWRLDVRVSNNNFWLISQLKFTFGGRIEPPPPKRHCFNWRICNGGALTFLETLLPYLHLKKAEAELAIKFQKRKHPNIGISDEERVLREAECILCHSLKSN